MSRSSKQPIRVVVSIWLLLTRDTPNIVLNNILVYTKHSGFIHSFCVIKHEQLL
jgi:hypothetical protein